MQAHKEASFSSRVQVLGAAVHYTEALGSSLLISYILSVRAVSSFFRSVSDSDSSSSDEEEELTDSGSDSGLDAKQTKKGAKKGSDSDDSDSDSDDSDSDEEDKAEVKKPIGSRFLKGAASDDSDSDDERTKVVKSAKSKRADEVEACVKSIDNASKINDWSAISNGQSRLNASLCIAC